MAEKKKIKDKDIKEAVEAKEETDVGVADTQLTNLSREELMTELYRRGRTPEDVINQTNLTGPEIEALATLNEGKNKGGSVSKQMELFSEGGLKQEGGSVDPVSGNDVPVGSTKKEVRDDIPAQLSEGEFVMPADVVRFHGLDKMMELRDEAKRGLKRMEAMGQMGNADEATLPDDVPFDMDDLDIDDEPKEMAEGGVVQAANGTFMSPNTGIGGFQQSQFANYNPQFTPYMPTQLPTTSYIMPQQQATPLASQQTLPKFKDVIPAPEGKYDEIIEYENEEGLKLSIPFVNGKPIYPIPKGYKKVETGIVKDIATTTVPETTQTRKEDVTSTGGDDFDPEEEKKNKERREEIKSKTIRAEELGFKKGNPIKSILSVLVPFSSTLGLKQEAGTIDFAGNVIGPDGRSYNPKTGQVVSSGSILKDIVNNLKSEDTSDTITDGTKIGEGAKKLGVTPMTAAGLKQYTIDEMRSFINDLKPTIDKPEVTAVDDFKNYTKNAKIQVDDFEQFSKRDPAKKDSKIDEFEIKSNIVGPPGMGRIGRDPKLSRGITARRGDRSKAISRSRMLRESPIMRTLVRAGLAGTPLEQAERTYLDQQEKVEQDIKTGKADTTIPTYTGSKDYQQAMQVFDDGGSDTSSPDAGSPGSTDMGFSTASGGFIQKKNLPKAKKKMKQGGLASR